MFHWNTYQQLNAIIAGIVLLVFFYSFLFPWLNPLGLTIPSGCDHLPESLCRSRGLTRGFAQMVRFNIDAAQSFNPYCWRIFSFFLFQLFGRIVFSLWHQKKQRTYILVIDGMISVFHFAYSMIVLIPNFD